ncbi:hydrogen gas-evolving membrane-bound hydrogenase subunit E [Thiocapsa sp.]|uniref:hydrogen gas-evolving membrane-bound hydrogenase subunit E n=1 Tax=Thiocapsa sp. TaxID=2024551 RepID=UPI002D7E3D78|nr:hydrogen gas-evolving membrane-bound hydrogenase subunit E [Thiocapsa sp.]
MGLASRAGHLLLIALLAVIFGGLALAVLSLPSDAPGLSAQVEAAMADTGVTHPVTAVLLDFRGYDTLLEIVVLLLALAGVWSLAEGSPLADRRPGTMLDRLSRLYAPLMLMVAGYLLWAGSASSGGAFQAGAVLGAAGVVLTLTGWRLPVALAGWPLRLILVAGVAVFILAGLVSFFFGAVWLDYPLDWAGAVILLIEATASLSIGATLAALFLGGRPEEQP